MRGGKREPNRIRFTETALAKLRVKKGRRTWSDTRFSSLKILVSHTNHKVYQIIAKVNGSMIKESLKLNGRICEFPEVHPNKALELATKRLAELKEGVLGQASRKQSEPNAMTVEEAVSEYLSVAQARRRKPLKVSTATEFRRSLNKLMGDRWNQPLANITEKVIKEWHMAHVPVSTMRYLSALLNFWCELHKFKENPMSILRTLDKKWSVSSPKARSSLKLPSRNKGEGNLKQFYEALQILRESNISEAPNHALEVQADIFECLLFLGCRKGDLIGDSRAEREPLKWSEVDLEQQTITYLDTKNQSSPTVPICDHVLGLLKRRRALDHGPWVFANSHTAAPVRSLVDGVRLVRKLSGILWTPKHNRDTYAAFARRHNDHIRKLLSNHAVGNDITDQYALAGSGGYDDIGDDLVEARNEISSRIRQALGLPALNLVGILAA